MEESIHWAQKWLATHGWATEKLPEEVQATPWSNVQRLLTTEGYVYLKEMSPELALEPAVITILQEYSRAVPVVLSTNKELNCFLMKDAGVLLRQYLKDHFRLDLLCKAFAVYRYSTRRRSACRYFFLFRRARLAPEIATGIDMINQDVLSEGITAAELLTQ